MQQRLIYQLDQKQCQKARTVIVGNVFLPAVRHAGRGGYFKIVTT